MQGPDPSAPHPVPGFDQIVYLSQIVKSASIIVGDYSYYDDPDDAERFEDNNVLYHFDFVGDRLVIGRFVALARGVTFIMNGANHIMDGFSTYPFNIFGNGWETGFDVAGYAAHSRGDTIIGNDVWIGRNAQILPGVSIGNGAIVGANTVVASNIPPYAIVVGNPGRVVRHRFDPETVDRLETIAWWDWPADRITRNLDAIRGNDLAALEKAV